MPEQCFCGKPATMYVDSDSYQYQDHGQPVCDEHGEDGDPVETPIPWDVLQSVFKKEPNG